MTHLRGEEIVDLIEGRLSGDRARHVEACADCRSQADMLSATLRSARIDELPEPSPLFWDQLSARVAQAVREPSSYWSRLVRADGWRLAAATAALLVVAGMTSYVLFRVEPASTPGPQQASIELPADPETDPFVDAWDAIEAAAADLDWEDGQSIGIAAPPGSAERLVADLTAEERSELARLIEEEMKRTGA